MLRGSRYSSIVTGSMSVGPPEGLTNLMYRIATPRSGMPHVRGTRSGIHTSVVIETFPSLPPTREMPGPRNWKRQKRRNGLKEKKRQAGNEPVATPVIGGSLAPPDPAPQQVEEKEDVVTRPVDVELGAESDELGVGLLGEPPIYDPGTGPRVKSMGEFLRSSFASEPTWDDELCAEFAQEEMLEMLREVLPEEMALVSCEWRIVA